MKRHSFSLERVLDWKSVTAQQEQISLEALRRRSAVIQSSLISLDVALRGSCDPLQETISGHDLAYSARARAAVQKQKALTELDHAFCQGQLSAQQQRLRTVETERRLLDKLRERSRLEWRASLDRENDAQASDLYLAAWNRREKLHIDRTTTEETC